MFSIIGIVVVFGCIAAGYLMEHGNMKVLLQPAELIIIGGAALGTVLISNPVHTLKQMINGVLGAFGSSKYGTERYIETLKMMYELLQKARKEGLVALETDIEEPDKSPLFSKYETFVKQHHAVDFVCDTMRMAVSGPPEEIGRKVAAALVGTFLGILLCYGLVGPLASRMGKMADEEHAYMMVLRVNMIAFLKGIAPNMAVEMGRRTVPGHVRPSFKAVEEACRGARAEAPAAAAAG